MNYYDKIFENKKFEAAYQKIKLKSIRNQTPVESPIAVVLGGLPGAGKGNIYNFYDERLNDNIVHIDCDKFRRYHPDAASFLPEEYGDKTNEFVFAVVDRLIDELTPEKYNFIAESAMRTPNTAFYNTNNLKPLGYRVELAVMATNIETAWQGTISRFETAKAKYEEDIANGVPNPEPPRPVPQEFFDAVKANIENSFNMIYISENEKGERQTPVDDIFVYTRSGEVLYHMAETPDLNPVPILSARLHHSEEDAKKIIDKYIHSSISDDITRSGLDLLDEMADNNELFNNFLKFQGSIFKYSAYAALEFFAQKPDVNFIATSEQWEKAGYRIKPGSEGIIYTHTDGSIHEFFDFSQIDSEKPPVVWNINTTNVQQVKFQLEIPDNMTLINGLTSKYINENAIAQCMKHLNIKGNGKEFTRCYIGAVKTMIAGRLEVGGNKFGISADNSFLRSLTSDQKMHFIALCAQMSRSILKNVETVVNNIETERKIKYDLRTVDKTNNRRKTEYIERGTAGDSIRSAQKWSDIIKGDKNGNQSDNVGNNTGNLERERENDISGVPQKNDNEQTSMVQVRSDRGNIQFESNQYGTVDGKGTNRDLRSKMDEIHGRESHTSDGTAENGEQIPYSSTNSGRRSDGVQNTSGSAVHGGESETENVRGNNELGESENVLHGRNSNEGKSIGSEDRINTGNLQSLFLIEMYDKVEYYKCDNRTIEEILTVANDEDKPFMKMAALGTRIDLAEYAEIEQSDNFSFSVEVNFYDREAKIYEVNGGKGGISDENRNETNTNIKTIKISDFLQSKSQNTETLVDSDGVSLRMQEILQQIAEKENEMQNYVSNKEYARIAIAAGELDELNQELETLSNSGSVNDSDDLERAKQLIAAFVIREYDSEPEFDDINKIGIAHTTYTDMDIPLQVDADLENYRITYSFNNKIVNTEQYSSLAEMNSIALEHLNFDRLVALTNEEMLAGVFDEDETVDFTVVTINDSERLFIPGYLTDIDELNEYTDLVDYGENIDISYEYCSIGDEGEADSASSEQTAFLKEFFEYLDSDEHYQVLESDERTVNNPYFEPDIKYDLEQHLNINRKITDEYDYKGNFLLPEDEDNLFTAIKSVKPVTGEWTDINDWADILSIEDIDAINAACVDTFGIPTEKDMPTETFALLYQKSSSDNVEYRSAVGKFHTRLEEAHSQSQALADTTKPAVHEEISENRYETIHDMLSDFSNAYLSFNRPVSEEFLKGKYLLSHKNNNDNIFDNVVNNVELSNGQRVSPKDALEALNASPFLSISLICVDLIDTEEYDYHRNCGNASVKLLKPEEFFALYEQTQKLLSGEDRFNQSVIRDVERSREIIEKANKTVDEYISDKEYMPYIIDHFFARDEMENFLYEYQKNADPLEIAKNNLSSVSVGFPAPGTYNRDSRYFSMGVNVHVTATESGDGIDIKHQDTVVHYTWDEISELMKTSVDYFNAYEDAYDKAYNIPDAVTSERETTIENAFSNMCAKYEITAESEVKPYIDYIERITVSNNLPLFDIAYLRGYNSIERFGAPEHFNKLMEGKLFDFINDVNDIIRTKPDPNEVEKEAAVEAEITEEDDFSPVQTSMFDLSIPAPLPAKVVDGYNLTELLELDVMHGSGFEDGKFRISAYYKTEKPNNNAFADFLKQEYGIGGRSAMSPVRFQAHDAKGIELQMEDGKRYLFKWTEVAKMTANLIDRDVYITQNDIKRRINHAKWDIENRQDEPIILERAYRRLKEHGVTDEGYKDTLISYAEAYDMHSRGYEVDGYPEEGLTLSNREDDFMVTSLAYQAYQFEKTASLNVKVQNYTELSKAMERMGLDIENNEDSSKARTIHEMSFSVEQISNSFKDIPPELELGHEFDIKRPDTAKVVFDGINDAESIYLYVEKKLADGDTDKIHEYLESVRKSYYLNNHILDRANAALDTLKKFESEILKTENTENAELTENDMADIIPASSATYTIYQLKSSSELPENHSISFTGTDFIEKLGYRFPDISRYDEIWTEDVMNVSGQTLNDKLDNIFLKFNMNKPEEFKGHSLSVSDIIVIDDKGNKKAFYVEPVGFRDVTDRFYNPEKENEVKNENNEEKSETVVSDAQEPVSDLYYDEDDHADDDLPEISYAANPEGRFNDNMAAIRELGYLESYEQEHGNVIVNDYAKRDLRRYVGWGGLSDIFDESKQEHFFKREQLKKALTEQEYNDARASTLNAHFTPQIVIDAMYNAIKNMELPRDARILEPACGTGNFISRLPASFSNAQVVGVEIDSVTSKIARMLNRDNENVTIINSPFEKSGLENNSFDLAIGNVPFGNYNMIDPDYSQDWKIHDAFFRKALDKVAPGGVVAFVTSTGTLDKKNPKIREYLAERSDLIGAIRLPNNTFADAGTKTATDIIFLQKRENPRLKDDHPDWCYTEPNEDGLNINSYFVQNPQMVLGKMEKTSHFNMLTCTPILGASLEKQLDEATRSLNAKITVTKRENAAQKRQGIVEPWGQNFTYQINENGVFFRENNNMCEVKVNKNDKEKLSMLIDIRTAARDLIDLQRTQMTDEQLMPYRDKLNKLYDNYKDKYGNIAESKVIKVFGLDADLPIVLALEDYDKETGTYSKAEIFDKRTVSPYLEISEVSTLEDALQVSMDRKGKINVEYMAQLLKNTFTMENAPAVIADKLISRGYAYTDPSEIVAGEPYSGITERSEYLSGNVRMKLKTAEEYAETHPEYVRNVEALKQVIPEDIKAEEITVQMGCAWIDTEDYTKFLEELSDRQGYYNRRNCDVSYSAITGEFSINQARSKLGLNVNETTTYGTADFSLYNLAEKILNQRRIVVKRDYADPMDPSRTVNKTDVKSTKLANEKARLIKDKFKQWIFADEARKEKYEQRYNNIFNSLVGRSYDGSNLTFPGMSSDFVLRPHQKDCVARTIYGGNTLAAHVVGAGKSAVIISSVMKKKDIGLINKACVVVPKPLTEQTANEWRKIYPDAKVLTVKNEDLASEEKRKLFTAKVATGSYDAVIVSQEQFEKLAMSKDYRAEYIRKQLDELEEHLKDSKGDRHTVKDIETRKKKLQEKLEKITNPTSAVKAKDNLLEFESLGFDYLVVDEAHAYKNGFVMTKMNNVAGVTTRPSGRADDMQMKCDYFNEQFGQGHILFATGTPVSNSMTELYVMTRYLRPDILKSQGVARFDDWAATFGSVVTKNQQSADGRLKLKTKFASFSNLPELMSIYKEFADIQSAEKLNLPRPALKEGKVQIVKAQATKEQKAYVHELAQRAQAYEEGKVDSSVDNHLKITGEARLVGLGNMVVESLYKRRGEEPPADFVVEKNSKIDLCIKNVAEIYQKTNDTKGVQIIFSDIAVNSDNNNFSVYDYIKNELINEYGIPESEIVFGPKSDAKNREQIFNDINNSKYRVVIASTDTLGTGANIQKNLYALHHVDVPWKPSDFTQREGRILRQGNLNKEVEIYNYVTEGTLDSYLYQTVTDKARFIAQLLDNKAPARVSEDFDEKVLSFAEIQAVAEGNPDFKKRIELSNEISELIMLKNEYDHETAMTRKNLELYPQSIEKTKNTIADNSIDLSAANKISSDDFKITTHKGYVLTESKDINSYLLALVKAQLANPTNPSPVFTVGDFSVKIKASSDAGFVSIIEEQAKFEVTGKLSYSCEAGKDNTADNGKRLSNLFSKIIPHKAQELQTTLTTLENNMKQAETRIAIPFQSEDKLQKLTAEYNELEERLINLSVGGDEFTDSDEHGVIDDNSNINTNDEPEDNINFQIR